MATVADDRFWVPYFLRKATKALIMKRRQGRVADDRSWVPFLLPAEGLFSTVKGADDRFWVPFVLRKATTPRRPSIAPPTQPLLNLPAEGLFSTVKVADDRFWVLPFLLL
jgi:hypothetical protein